MLLHINGKFVLNFSKTMKTGSQKVYFTHKDKYMKAIIYLLFF